MISNSKLQIILVDWAGYPLEREKRVGENIVRCGLGRILENINKYSSGIDFEVTLVISINSRTKDGLRLLYRLVKKYILLQKNVEIFKNIHFNKSVLYKNLMKKYRFIKKVVFKNNIGQDIGSYNCGYLYLKHIHYHEDVIFMNSSLAGPDRDFWIDEYAKSFDRNEKNGLLGISMNSHNTNKKLPKFDPHVQSFFLYSNMKKLKKVFPNELPGSNIYNDKLNLIEQGEIGISREFLKAGYGIGSKMFNNDFYFLGDTWKWPEGDLRYSKNTLNDINKI